MKTWLFVLFLATGSILSAEVVTSVTCTVYGNLSTPSSTVTDPSSCALRDPDVQNRANVLAMATANASFSLASDPNSFSSLSADQDVGAGLTFDKNGQYITSRAGSDVSVKEALFTTGPVRPGFVQISASGQRTSNFRGSSGTLDVLFGHIAVSCHDNGFGSVASCILWPNGEHSVPAYLLPVSGQSYPFTLGQVFNFSYLGSAGADSLPGYGGFGADASVQFQFRFFEADGVTPVSVEAVPEPGTFALFGVAWGLLAAVKRKFRR